MLARGFGGHKISALLERVRNNKSRHFKHVTTLIGINDCLSSDFDAKEAVSSLEKLIYLINHKFSPETNSQCTVTPLGAFRKDFNPNVQKLNKQILNFVHLNFQSIIRKRMQLKKFLDDMGENTIIGISETWLKKEIVPIYGISNLERMRCSDMIGNQR